MFKVAIQQFFLIFIFNYTFVYKKKYSKFNMFELYNKILCKVVVGVRYQKVFVIDL